MKFIWMKNSQPIEDNHFELVNQKAEQIWKVSWKYSYQFQLHSDFIIYSFKEWK